ncbi:MAG: hypothetical protein JJT75_08540 [Opitutales bacterium]|nr:hypothetical protein [Opitutales bacterium]
MKRYFISLSHSLKFLPLLKLSLLSFSYAEADAESSTKSQTIGLIPESELVLRIDLADINKSSFMQTLEEEGSFLLEIETEKAHQEFTERTGMQVNDFSQSLISLRISDADIETIVSSRDPMQTIIREAESLFTLSLNNPLTERARESLLEWISREVNFTLEEPTEKEHRDVPYTLMAAARESSPDLLYALLDDEKILIASTSGKVLRSAIDRYLDDAPATQLEVVSSELKRMQDQQFALTITFPEQFRAASKASFDEDMAGEPFAAMMVRPLLQWNGLSVSLKFDKSLEGLWLKKFDTKEAAASVSGMVNLYFRPMLTFEMRELGFASDESPGVNFHAKANEENLEIGITLEVESILHFLRQMYAGHVDVEANLYKRAMKDNLRQISAAASQYFLETGESEVDISDLVGESKYIRRIEAVGNEVYGTISNGEVFGAIAPDENGQFPSGEWIIRKGDTFAAEDPDTRVGISYSP